jgi:HlyD family secretion protein
MTTEMETERKKEATMTETAKTLIGQTTEKPAKKKNRRMLYLLIGLGVIVIIIIAVAALRPKGEKPTAITTEKAATRTVTQVVSATGKIQPEDEVKLAPEVSGEIVELPVKDGQKVKKGQLLFRINPQITKAQVDQSRAALASAKSQNLQAKAQMLRNEEEFRRADNLYKQKLMSESDYLTAKTNLEVSKATFEASNFDIQRVASQLSQAVEQLSRTTVVSPRDGTISSLTAKLGERVVGSIQMAGTEILRVADLSMMEIRVDVNENDIVNVKAGDTARVTVDAYPNRKFAGVVREIANAASTKGVGTQEEVTNFLVKIRILDHQGALRPGMSASADVETFTAKDAITVPIQSVTVRTADMGISAGEATQKRESGKSDDDVEVQNEKMAKQQEKADRAKMIRVVFVKDGEMVRQVKVETGIADNTYIVVKKGLAVGDEVVAGPYRAISRDLKDSAKVVMEIPGVKK